MQIRIEETVNRRTGEVQNSLQRERVMTSQRWYLLFMLLLEESDTPLTLHTLELQLMSPGQL